MLARLQVLATRVKHAQAPDHVPPAYSDPRIEQLLKKRPLEAPETSSILHFDLDRARDRHVISELMNFCFCCFWDLSPDMVARYMSSGSRGVQDEHRIFSAIISAAASLRISADTDGSSPMQNDIMAAVVLSVLRWIYRDSWSKSKEEILAFHGLDRSFEWIVIVAGRRVGKSAASAAALAAILAFIPGKFFVRIYAQGLEIAKVMLRDVHGHLLNIPNKANVLKRFNESGDRPFIELVNPNFPSKPIIAVAYPSGSNNNRGGVNPNMVVIDEALAVKEQTMKVGILPSLLLRNTSLLMISSPYDKPRCITELVVNLRHPVTQEQFCR